MEEWVEVEAESVDDAIDAALEELGIKSRDQANIEVLKEPKGGFLGLGSQPAQVKVSRKPKSSRRRRRRRKRSGGQDGDSNRGRKGTKSQEKPRQEQPRREKPRREKAKNKPKRDKSPRDTRQKPKQGSEREESGVTTPETTIDDQAALAKEFLEGLLAAFGLEGEVATRVEDGMLFLDVTGDQTEALVGQKGAILQAIHELTRTVIQRKTFRAPRMRLDIAGYNERRRAGLKIFAGQVAERVLEGGGELALEPMNPADRKVLHDAVAEIDGVRSFSEGQDPRRFVVIAPTDAEEE